MLFEAQRKQQPHALALTDTQQQRSWIELYQQVLKLKHFLNVEQGLQANQHIALLIGNRVEFFEAMLAGMVAGVWVTPINTHLSEQEARYILENCDASLLFHDQDHEAFAQQNLPCPAVNIERLSQGCLKQQEQMPDLPNDTKAGGTMLYTSGTTGKPKGVRRNKPELFSDALVAMQKGARNFGLEGKGPHLITGPLYHAAPMLFALYDMLNGAPVIIMPKWNTQHFLELLDEFQVYSTHLVPTMFVRLLHLREQHREQNREQQKDELEKPASLKYVLHGAAPIAVSVKQKMIDWWGPILTEYWGASEAGTSTLVNSQEWLQHPGTVGKALAHLEIYVGNEQGEAIDDETGMLFCRHATLEQVFEYHKDPEKTKAAHPKPYTFCIGDIGRVDKEGYVYLSDRKSNMIISGGVNIYPAEIEQALIEHPAIADLAVFGVADDEWGESVKALIELKPGNEANTALIENIKVFASEKIARYKVPKHIEFIDKLPRNAAGKVAVHKLKTLK